MAVIGSTKLIFDYDPVIGFIDCLREYVCTK